MSEIMARVGDNGPCRRKWILSENPWRTANREARCKVIPLHRWLIELPRIPAKSPPVCFLHYLTQDLRFA
jgi:hypothetical protein